MHFHYIPTLLAIISLPVFLAGCASLLPHAHTSTVGPWQNYYEAQQAFDKIVPYQTTLEDLKTLKLDPQSNPNITILNYSDVIRRFIPSPSVSAEELAPGVRACILAKAACNGYEIVQSSNSRKRHGNFWADFTNFKRKVEITGWSFNGVILVKDNVVIYTLTGGQPAIYALEENKNPLGPFQGSGESALRNSVPLP
ncbi:MAG: hypothetical protein NUV55_04420 [Sulfuricaulis sp.]|uniref:hypothetical protein n=1 Tax=Sulfuricaulis sp. TaxID=2003553 RepID=UPI0025DB4AC5|nr:hypothetical protein [Sulfuricaulis sp.]MCR4346443.1 hypothetical protein [Sulfuricaulis sp.]